MVGRSIVEHMCLRDSLHGNPVKGILVSFIEIFDVFLMVLPEHFLCYDKLVLLQLLCNLFLLQIVLNQILMLMSRLKIKKFNFYYLRR